MLPTRLFPFNKSGGFRKAMVWPSGKTKVSLQQVIYVPL